MAVDAPRLERAAPLPTARELTCSSRAAPQQVTQGLFEVRLAERVPRLAELGGEHFLAGTCQFASALRT